MQVIQNKSRYLQVQVHQLYLILLSQWVLIWWSHAVSCSNSPVCDNGIQGSFISERERERELTFTFALCYRPSVVCLSVTSVRPTQSVKIFGNSVCRLSVVCDVGAPYSSGWTFRQFFFHHTIAQRLYFSGAKNLWWGTPLSPEICVQSDPPPFKQRNFDQYRLIVPKPW